jgi:hypothetical protein
VSRFGEPAVTTVPVRGQLPGTSPPR